MRSLILKYTVGQARSILILLQNFHLARNITQ